MKYLDRQAGFYCDSIEGEGYDSSAIIAKQREWVWRGVIRLDSVGALILPPGTVPRHFFRFHGTAIDSNHPQVL